MYSLRRHIIEPLLLLFVYLVLHHGAENYALRAAKENGGDEKIGAARSLSTFSAPSHGGRVVNFSTALSQRNLKPPLAFDPAQETKFRHDLAASPLPRDAAEQLPNSGLATPLHPRAPPTA